ncbi:MAG: sulfatase-like hydrolase/transferase [Planctomycetota bacterium]
MTTDRTPHLLAVLLACIAAICCSPALGKPDIVIILTDDAGYGDFGFTGGTLLETPNIDRIANEGVRLTQFYTTASVCSPSRAGFITGRYQQRFGHHSNLTGQAARRGLGLPTSERTIADHLNAHGYHTGIVGKWHLGEAPELVPTARGFDEFEGLVGGSRSFYAIESRDPIRSMQRRTPTTESKWFDEAGTDGFYVTDWTGDRSVDFISRHASSDDPYFLFASFTAPHTPMHAKADDLAKFSDVAPERRRIYAAMMLSLDEAVGDILDAVDASGEADDTIVMFFNDNGGATNNGSDNGRYRGMKGSKWEGGVRVPAAIRWPSAFVAGADYHNIVSAMDFAATAIAAAGGPLEDAMPLDGLDLTPALSSDAALDEPIRDTLFWKRGPAGSVRSGPWKLIFTDATDPVLYHIPADPSETIDLASEQSEVVERLMTQYESWVAEHVDAIWTEGDKWENYQRRKHNRELFGRPAERRFP